MFQASGNMSIYMEEVMRFLIVAVGLLFAVPSQSIAQDFNYTPGWSNTQNFNRLYKRSRPQSGRRLPPCTVALLSPSDRRRMERQYGQIARSSGERQAALWAQK